MLRNIDLDDKGYDRIREEAIARIPVYSREWTNYNISDPGITILENFSAFMALQQSEMNEIPDRIRMHLLSLAGFTAAEGRCARAFLLPEMPENLECACLPPRMKLYAQDICFELEQCGAVRSMCLTDECGKKGGAALFGEHPAGGEAVYFSVEGFPEAGRRAALYIEIKQQFERNPFSDDQDAPDPFAELLWEVWTENGYARLEVEDGTHCFLQSGYVIFSMDEGIRGSLMRDSEDDLYRMRVTLVRSDYDIAPRVQRICGLLLSAVQRDTRSSVQLLPVLDGKICVTDCLVRNDWGDAGYFEVYGKEADGVYRRYHDLDRVAAGVTEQAQKRVYRAVREGAFTAVLTLAGYDIPESELPREALVVCRFAAYGSLGRLYGYDSQIMQLPDLGSEKICSQEFSVLVVEQGADGSEICHVVRPGDRTAGEVYYSVSETDGVLTVCDCGRYEGAELRLGDAAFYRGDGGNIRAGTRLESTGTDLRMTFVNCADTDTFSCTAGSYAEGFEQVRKRFVRDLARPATMITQEDCAYIVKNTPGLSIHKIGVCPMPERNEICITVKPNSTETFPALSDIYQKEIRRCVERCRMLTTKILLRQPVYVPICVRGVVSVRKHLVHSREKIEEMLSVLLDGIRSDAPFGSRIIFHEVYNSLQEMDCVEEVIDLSVFPGNDQWARRDGMDIQLGPSALYYPGEITIESVSRQEF